MFDGFLRLGGVELVNSSRAKGYGETADCPVGWFQCECEGLHEALLEREPYSADDIAEAPWYDPRNPESARFYGVLGLGMRNLSDSTRYAEVTEGITDGGVAGAPRRAGKSVRVRAWLSAAGEDALEYGMSWLGAALASRRCVQHNDACGGASAEFFVACPPGRGLVPGLTDWELIATNLATNPSFEDAGSIPAGSVSSTDWAASGTRSIKVEPASASYGYGFGPYGAGPYGTGPEMSNFGSNFITLATLDNQTLLIAGRYAGQIVRFGGVDRFVGADGGVVRVTGSGEVRISAGWWDNLLIATGLYSDDYFDGSRADDEQKRFSWTGATNSSTSIREARYPTQRPQTDGEYLPEVVARQRFLHGVSVISGPLEIQTVRHGESWGREVEFTLYAEQPGIYAAPRNFGVLESIGKVVDDVVRNLVPYPSAELGISQAVVAYNHVTNPSLELDATGWKGGLSGGDDMPGAPAIGTVTSGVVKNTRSYAGASSFLARWLGDGKTVGTGQRIMSIEYEQRSMPGIAPGDVVTVSIWAALVIQAGTPLAAGEDLTASYAWIKADGSFVGPGVSLGSATGADRGGKVFSLGGITVPATATGILFQLGTTNIGAYSSPDPAVNRDIRLYADAAGVIEEV